MDFRNYGNGIIYWVKNVKSIKEFVKNILRNNSDVYINDINMIFKLLNVIELEGFRFFGVFWYSGLFVYKVLVLVVFFVVLLWKWLKLYDIYFVFKSNVRRSLWFVCS